MDHREIPQELQDLNRQLAADWLRTCHETYRHNRDALGKTHEHTGRAWRLLEQARALHHALNQQQRTAA